MPKRLDLTGRRFGALTVLEISGRYSGNRAIWRCLCDCGGSVDVRIGNLTNGHTESCGCQSSRLRTKHGLWRTREYGIWGGMLDRCRNPRNPNFPHYGGRGIRVCDSWSTSFEAFIADMGRAPSAMHSLDRIDVNGNYEPGNVRWATHLEQMQNLRSSRKVVYQGRERVVSALAREHGLHPSVVKERLKLGWSIEAALTTEVEFRRPRGARGAA